MNKRILFILLSGLVFLFSCNQPKQVSQIKPGQTEIEKALWNEHLNSWYPVCIDSANGGYLSNLAYDFKPMENQDKMIVTQARHLWTTSVIAKN
ncbi:MAG: AGE family epimerase/isomerase, partial [Chitinophagaceae bacterium]